MVVYSRIKEKRADTGLILSYEVAFMIRSTFFLAIILCVLSSLTGADEQPVTALPIGSNKQLFIDDRFIETSSGVSFCMNPPVKAGPVELPLDPKGYVGVVDYRDTCYLYYQVEGGYAVAVSKDGISFNEPRGESLVFPDCREGSVFIDPKDLVYPFKAIWDITSTRTWGLQDRDREKLENRTLYLFRSRDGLSWEIIPEIAVPFLCDSQNQCLYDPRIDRYVAYLRGFPEAPGYPFSFRRTVVRTETADLMDMPWPYTNRNNRERSPGGGYGYIWNEMAVVLGPDSSDPFNTDLYNPNVVAYPWAADVYLAFPSMFRTYGYGARGKRAQSYGRDLRGDVEGDGLFEVHLAVSRDGISFTRVREPYLRAGLISNRTGTEGDIDSGLILVGIGMIRRGDDLYQYYYGSRRTHISQKAAEQHGLTGQVVMRTVQRLDGFMSIDAGPDGGELVTPPVLFEGNRLELNADCGGLGELWVELQDENGLAFPGYTLEEAVSIDRNGTAQEIWWHKGPDVGELANKPVWLRIKMRAAKLYAFQFVSR